jgi:O-antigen/teichoic acid export membrane protein
VTATPFQSPPPPLAHGELTRRYVVNTLSLALVRLTAAGVGLWAARELVRILGSVEFGLVVLSTSIVGYMAFLGLGLPAAFVRQVANYSGRGLHGRLRRLIGSAFLAFAAIGSLGALCLALFATRGGLALLSLPEGAEASARAALLATALVVMLSWPVSVFSSTLIGLQRYPARNAVAGVASLAAAFAAVWTARRGGGAAGVILATGSVVVLSGLAQSLLVRRFVRPAPAGQPAASSPPGSAVPRGVLGELRPLVRFSLWLLAIDLAGLMMYQTDQILLGTLLSVESITAYYVAAKLHNLVREGNGLLHAALFPLLAEEHGRGNALAEEHAVYRGTRYIAALVVPTALTAMLVAEPFIRIWMGESFVGLAPLAQAFVSYWMVAVLTSMAGQVALGRGDLSRLGGIALGAAVVNVAVSLLLVRHWGVGGVIAGTLVAYGLGLPAQFRFLFPRLGIDGRRFLREVIVPVYGVVAPACAVWWLLLPRVSAPDGPLGLLLQAALIAGSCWAGLWFVAVEPRDRRRILTRLGALLPAVR